MREVSTWPTLLVAARVVSTRLSRFSSNQMSTPKEQFKSYYNTTILPRLDTYPPQFRKNIALVIARLDKLEFLPYSSCTDENGARSPKPTTMMVDDLVRDLLESRIAGDQALSMGKNGRLYHPAGGIEEVKTEIRMLVDDYRRDPRGEEPAPKDNGCSLLCQELSCEGVDTSSYFRFPLALRSKRPEWQRIVGTDLPRICVTATPPGNVTLAHHDDVALDTQVLHIAGIKLWLLWDNSRDHTKAVAERKKSYDSIDLQWLFDNFVPPKVK